MVLSLNSIFAKKKLFGYPNSFKHIFILKELRWKNIRKGFKFNVFSEGKIIKLKL